MEAQKGNCICNLGSLKRDIRKNSIAISQVKNFALHNDNRIQKNLDKINENMVDMTTTKILRTCHELEQIGVQTSGMYLIDPDGEMMGDAPINVYCDFKNGGNAITEVYNLDNMEQQIEALIQLSSSCLQNVTLKCYGKLFYQSFSDFKHIFFESPGFARLSL